MTGQQKPSTAFFKRLCFFSVFLAATVLIVALLFIYVSYKKEAPGGGAGGAGGGKIFATLLLAPIVVFVGPASLLLNIIQLIGRFYLKESKEITLGWFSTVWFSSFMNIATIIIIVFFMQNR